MKNRLLALIASALMMGPLAATATAIGTYTDRAAWRTAAGGGTGDIVEEFTGVYNHLPFDAGEFVVSETGDGAAIIIVAGVLVTNLDSWEGNDTISFTFDSPVRAFGFSLVAASAYSGATISFTTNIGDIGSYTLPDSLEFRGFLFSAPTTTFTIDHTAGGSYNLFAYHSMDDLEAFSAPEPSSLALFGLGLMGLAFTRRRWQ